MIVSEIKIERLQPEKSRNLFEWIQKMKKSRAIVFDIWLSTFRIWWYKNNKKLQEREVRLNEMRLAMDKFRQYLVNQNKRYGAIDFNE